jgi:hypothetical protein
MYCPVDPLVLKPTLFSSINQLKLRVYLTWSSFITA